MPGQVHTNRFTKENTEDTEGEKIKKLALAEIAKSAEKNNNKCEPPRLNGLLKQNSTG
jgi:hypothetical protein